MSWLARVLLWAIVAWAVWLGPLVVYLALAE